MGISVRKSIAIWLYLLHGPQFLERVEVVQSAFGPAFQRKNCLSMSWPKVDESTYIKVNITQPDHLA